MLNYEKLFWRERIFGQISIATVLYIVLTGVAMFFYPGGTLSDPSTHGYSFFKNFFSDLGVSHTTSGAPNFVSASLFFSATMLAGLAVIMFSLAFPQFFQKAGAGHIQSMAFSVFGTSAGVSLVGVAFTPADILLGAHIQFSFWFFRLFTIAAFLGAIAVFRHGKYPKRYAWIFLGFGVLLIAYVLLMQFGPSPKTTVSGTIIQATGQKIIAYASLGSVLIQAHGAKAFNKS
jgi:hypothetical protein